MPDTEHKVRLEQQAIERVAKALGVPASDLDVEGVDTGMTRIHRYERIAEIVEEQTKRRNAEAKAAINEVKTEAKAVKS